MKLRSHLLALVMVLSVVVLALSAVFGGVTATSTCLNTPQGTICNGQYVTLWGYLDSAIWGPNCSGDAACPAFAMKATLLDIPTMPMPPPLSGEWKNPVKVGPTGYVGYAYQFFLSSRDNFTLVSQVFSLPTGTLLTVTGTVTIPSATGRDSVAGDVQVASAVINRIPPITTTCTATSTMTSAGPLPTPVLPYPNVCYVLPSIPSGPPLPAYQSLIVATFGSVILRVQNWFLLLFIVVILTDLAAVVILKKKKSSK